MSNIRTKAAALVLALCVLVGIWPAVTTTAMAADNTSRETAQIVTGDQMVNVELEEDVRRYYAIRTTKPGQFISVVGEADVSVECRIYPTDTYSGSIVSGSGMQFLCTGHAEQVGTYYIVVSSWNANCSASFTVTLTDNDEYESNNTKENARQLPVGQTAEIVLGGGEQDWFTIETTKPGQDIQVDISGFHYANKGELQLSFDPVSTDSSISVFGNETFYFHAAQAGTHYIKLYNGCGHNEETGYTDSDILLPLSVTATVLDGDKHEIDGNESAQQAVTLNLGTDEIFQVGGWGDEDWFQFEVAPEVGSSNLYTLQFLDLNPDYSDEFYYEVYAPDGTVVTSQTLVTIQHTNILACNQQGMYQVRIYGQRRYALGEYIDNITRSTLRIRVSMGGADPYENNDTWLEAKTIQPGQLIQHVLASDADRDWFYFTAEQADMSFTLEFDQPTCYEIYRAADLAEFGADVRSLGSDTYSPEVGSYYYKLYGAGVYYVNLYTETKYTSEELRSFTVTLTPHRGEENNDAWDKAVPIYESVPQEFDLAGYNDTDWFRFTVPAGAAKVTLMSTEGPSYHYGKFFALYREEDLFSVGLNAKPLGYSTSDGYSYIYNVSAGTYYVKTRVDTTWDPKYYAKDCTLTYWLTYDIDGSTMETALPLLSGQWSQPATATTWYRLGALKAGDVVRYNRDGSGNSERVYLCDNTGSSRGYSNYANDAITVPSDGEYYLEVVNSGGLDANGEWHTTRIRYDIGSKEEKEVVTTRENIIVLDSAPSNLDPTAVNKTGAAWLWHVYEMPYQVNGFGGDIVPVLVDSSKGDFKPGMSHEAGSNEYILYIQKGITDHAGNELKASDVVFSYDLLINSGNAHDMSAFQKAEVVDDYTVKLTFTRELNLVGELVTYFARVFFVTEAAYKDSPSGFISDACGTGPYKLESFTSGSGMTLVRNEDYWCTADQMTNQIQLAKVSSIRYTYVSEPNTVAVFLASGEADAASNLSPAYADDFLDGGSCSDIYDTHVYWDSAINCILPNCHPDSLTGDVNMRKAIFYAISVEGIAAALSGDAPGSYRACYGMGNPSFPDYSEDWAKWNNYQTVTDQAKVMEYLNKAGYNGETVEIIATSGDTETIAVVIAGMLEQVGIKPHITLVDRTTQGVIKNDPTAWHISIETKDSSDYIVNVWDKLWKSNNSQGFIAQSGQFIKDDEFLAMCLESKIAEGHTQENVDEIQQYIIDHAYAMGLTQKSSVLVYPTDVKTLYLTDKNYFIPGAATYTGDITYEVEYANAMEGPNTITLKVGETRFVDLRLAPYTASSGANNIYLDQNTDSNVATYDNSTGYVTAKTLGTTTMTFEVRCNGKYLTKTVTVNVAEPVVATEISIPYAPAQLELGGSAQLSANLFPVSATEDVVWSSSDTSVLYVSSKGKVVAVGEGEATITASVAAACAAVSIKVVPAQVTEEGITSLVLDNYALTMYLGEGTQKLAATVLPEGVVAVVQWVSSNTGVATVDQSGVITAVAPGISIITAKAGDHNASCIVTVQGERVNVTGISFGESKLQIPLGGQTTLVPTIEPYNATTKTLTWVSDDPSVATVSRTGIVNALAVGVTTIRATTMDGGFVAEITIEVTAKARLGDIDGNGYIDSNDALITLRVVVGLRTLTEEEKAAADVNKDGCVDAGDGVKILRYDAKLIDSLE